MLGTRGSRGLTGEAAEQRGQTLLNAMTLAQ
jgi:hypothetical protein